MKDDLISRRAIFHELLVYGGKVCPDNDVDGFPITIKVCYIKEAIRNVPAADVRSKRHGEWKINSNGYYPYCSECNKEPQGQVMTKWCPNCGAKMDGKEDEK